MVFAIPACKLLSDVSGAYRKGVRHRSRLVGEGVSLADRASAEPGKAGLTTTCMVPPLYAGLAESLLSITRDTPQMFHSLGNRSYN